LRDYAGDEVGDGLEEALAFVLEVLQLSPIYPLSLHRQHHTFQATLRFSTIHPWPHPLWHTPLKERGLYAGDEVGDSLEEGLAFVLEVRQRQHQLRRERERE